MMGNQV